jgi:hypothetical protein
MLHLEHDAQLKGAVGWKIHDQTLRRYCQMSETSVYPCSRIIVGKHLVDGYIRELDLHGCFLYTGNFYENMILRKHVSYDQEKDTIFFKQPVIKSEAKRRLRRLGVLI